MKTNAAPDQWLGSIRTLAGAELKKLAGKIDRDGVYPREFLRSLGERGGFGSSAGEDPSVDLARQFQAIALVGRYCGATAFLAWCQSACAWYLQHARVEATRRRYLARVASGRDLSGTGMSNTIK